VLSIRLLVLVALPFFGTGSAHDRLSDSSEPSVPVCVEDHILGQLSGGLLATLEWEDSGEHGPRRVTVLFDPAGGALQYSEISTEGPIEVFDRQDSYRLVFMNFLTDFGVVELQDSDGERSQEERSVEEILRSTELGNPFGTIQLVRAKCAGFKLGLASQSD